MILDNLKLKPIPGFDERYWANYDGRILSIRGKRWMKPYPRTKGRKYLSVCLHHHGKQHNCLVHKLIAAAWIPNPNNLPYINHIDENPQNNCVANLERCTNNYNINYGTRNERARKSLIGRCNIKIKCLDNGKIWDSLASCAQEMGISYSAFNAALRGGIRVYKGYTFELLN